MTDADSGAQTDREPASDPEAKQAAGLSDTAARFAVRRRTLFMLVTGLLMVGLADGQPVMYAVGAGLLALSHGIRLWASGYIYKDEELVICGPFAWTRNPLYVANLIGAVALALMCGRWELVGLVVAGWVALHLPAVASEECFLREKFGASFDDYCARVPRWLPRPTGACASMKYSLRRVLINREHINVLGGWLLAAVFYIEMVK